MTYELALTALADPTRRAILAHIRQAPASVADIARPLPVSRPAVSQHLKVLKEAGLVSVTAQGTRNLYRLAPAGVKALHDWVGTLWQEAQSAPTPTQTAPSKDALAPIEKTFHVRLSPPEAFALFTEDIALWWPVAQHSLSAQSDGALPMALVFHTGPDGRIEETQTNGTTGTWGRVTGWSPPQRLQLAWHVGRPAAQATRIAISFDADGRNTRVTLTHDAWEAIGPEAAALRAHYDTGWDYVMGERYTAAAHAALSNF